ncbi:hypothetical protein CW304_04490 [Bacillus sp. UFRGS-B20]|nr:hypothetical protein CW304_04490 [Bacillus sp. UFRGS-B20]
MLFKRQTPRTFIFAFRLFICRNYLFQHTVVCFFPPLFLLGVGFHMLLLDTVCSSKHTSFTSSSSNHYPVHKGKRHLPAFLLAFCASLSFSVVVLHEEFSVTLQFAFSTSCILACFSSSLLNSFFTSNLTCLHSFYQ